MSSNSFALGERVLAFDDNGLDILNEELRQLQDRTFQIKSSSSDTTPAYLDNSILNITILGDVIDGTAAGWEIEETSFKSGSGVTTVGLDSGGVNPSIYCGSATPASAPFRVTNAGVLTATSGTVGAFTLDTDKFYAGTDADYMGFIPGTGIQMGDSTFNDAEFSVTNAGALVATTGTIKGLLTVGTAGTTIGIDGANNRIRTSDYVSGALGTGWNIDSSVAEFNNIRARGKITTAVFEKESISVIGGNLLVMPGDILSEDMSQND